MVAIAFAPHAGADRRLSKPRLVKATGILAAAIAMVEQSGLGMPTHERHGQRLLNQFRITMGCHSSSYHQAREQIKHDRDIEPTLRRLDAGEIRHPLGIESLYQYSVYSTMCFLFHIPALT